MLAAITGSMPSAIDRVFARLSDELVGDPLRDVGGVRHWQTEDEVLEAGFDCFAEGVLGLARLEVGH